MSVFREERVAYQRDRVLVIGGGAAGISIGKAFQQRSIPFDVIEREGDFGGNWYFGSAAARVYRSTHLISSRTNTQFSDYPMPPDYPQYPSHAQFLAYLRSAAKHFGLYEHTTFGVELQSLTPSDGGWLVQLSNGAPRWYPDVVVANGLLRQPYTPNIAGSFNGELIHSSNYTDPAIFEGKRVLVVGCGNSGCDIAVDCAARAQRTCHSTRRGYHYMPKFIHGKPTQEWLMEIVSQFDSPEAYWSHVKATFKLAGFDGVDYGLPMPDHDIHQAHPVMNSNVLYHVGHGDIAPKPDIERFDGEAVVFTDGSSEVFDVVVLATGFKPSLPFLDPALVDWKQGLNHLFLNSVPTNFDNIVFAGYFNIPSGFGNIANTCARFLANYFIGKRQRSKAWFVLDKLKHYGRDIDLGQGQFVTTRRHAYELDLWKYVKTINFLNERLEARESSVPGSHGSQPAPVSIRGDKPSLSTPDKALLLKRVREGSLSPDAVIATLREVRCSTPPPTGEPWQERFLHDLSGLIAKLLRRPADEIDLDGAVADMGLDSLSATEFSNNVRAQWGVSLQATAFFECNTVRDFHLYMLRLHGAALQAHYGAAQRSLAPVPAVSTARAGGDRAVAPQPASSDPIRDALRKLWQLAEQDVAQTGQRSTGPAFSRLVIARSGYPAIEICVAGNGDPVLLLGGLMNPDGIWHRQIDALAQHRRVIVFNKPGCGRSDVDVRRLSIDSIVSDLEAALDVLHLTTPLTVVGFSFGGMLAQTFAHRNPQRVARLALINTTACARPRPNDVQILKDELARCPEVVAINGDIDFALAACYREVSCKFDLRATVPTLRMPALVLSAQRDGYINEGQCSELADLLPTAQHVVIADAGHFSLLTHWEQVNRHLLRFLMPDAAVHAALANEVVV